MANINKNSNPFGFIPDNLAPKNANQFGLIPDSNRVNNAGNFTPKSSSLWSDIVGGLSQAGSQTLDDLKHLGGKSFNALNVLAPDGTFVQSAAHALAQNLGNKNDLTYEAANLAGNTVPFLAGAEGLEALRLGAEATPLLGIAAKELGGAGIRGISRRAIGSSLYGALTNPGHRVSGAEFGAIASPVADAIPGMAKGVGKLARKAIPQLTSHDLLGFLGNNETLQNNATAVAKAIKKSYDDKKMIAKGLYDDAFNNLSGHLLFSPGNEGVESSFFQVSNPVKTTINQNGRLSALITKYQKEPTLKNAHQVKSSLLSFERKIRNSASPSYADLNQADNFGDASDALKSDIDKFLYRQHPDRAAAYRDADEYWARKVVPFVKNKTIKSITQNEITQPKNLQLLFKTQDGPSDTVLSQLPDKIKNRILYDKLGGMSLATKPKALAQKFQKISTQSGFSHVITPEALNSFIKLNRHIGYNKAALAMTALPLILHAPDLLSGSLLDLGAGAGSSLAAYGLGKFTPTYIEKGLTAAAPYALKPYKIGAKVALANLIRGNTQ